jgi:predicted HTH transcriptional regulator
VNYTGNNGASERQYSVTVTDNVHDNGINGADSGTIGANYDADGAKTGADDDGNRNAVLNLMKREQTISLDTISERTGISTRTLDRIIMEMKNSNVIQRLGSKRSGYWKVMDNGGDFHE